MNRTEFRSLMKEFLDRVNNITTGKYPAVMTALKDFAYLIELHKKNVDVGVLDEIPSIKEDFISGNWQKGIDKFRYCIQSIRDENTYSVTKQIS